MKVKNVVRLMILYFKFKMFFCDVRVFYWTFVAKYHWKRYFRLKAQNEYDLFVLNGMKEECL